MIRKTALLAGVAGAMLFAAPALAQDATTTAAASAQTATPATLTLQPGATVKGEGGVELGKLQGVRTNAAGEQELEVRGADGQLRAVPLGGLQQDGDGLMVAWSKAQYDAAAVIQGSDHAPATPVQPAAPAMPAAPATTPGVPATAPDPSMPAMPATPAAPAMPAAPATPANPPAGEPMDPAQPPVPNTTPPTLPPENPVGTTPTAPNPSGGPPTTPQG